jgi:peptidoglycan-N-acetylglucosamine deacetylase
LTYNKTHIFSVDLESLYTTSYYNGCKKNIELCNIKKPTYDLLNLFECKEIKVTFFVLGRIAEEEPFLIKEISRRGHEVASHGYSHKPLNSLTPREFEQEIIKTNNLIQEITGLKVKGFRAPFFSLNNDSAWAIDILKNHGFLYDASIFPMKTPRYGIYNSQDNFYKISSKDISVNCNESSLLEFPHSLFKFGNFKIPCAGGIYSRFIPYMPLKHMLKNIEKERVINFYTHPWEFENIHNIKTKLPAYKKFLAHYNSKNHLKKIEKLVADFTFTSFEKFIDENIFF